MDKLEVILQIKEITKEFPISETKKVTVCDRISLNVYRGKTLGIVGESGCGKSTLVKTIVQMHSPTAGSIYFNNEDITKCKGEKARQIRKHIQMVFQDPTASFNPKMLIKDIVCEPLRNFNLIKKRDIRDKAIELLEQVGLSADFADRYPHSMSGGQRQRVGIARALALEPEIIIFDEATSALDVSIQKSIIELLKDLQKEKKLTYIFICHDLALVNQFSDEVAIMYLGNLMEVVSDMSKGCKHPYSKALLDSVFHIGNEQKEDVKLLEGEIPSLIDLPKGCPFQTRCGERIERCKIEKPQLAEVSAYHKVACHHYREADMTGIAGLSKFKYWIREEQ